MPKKTVKLKRKTVLSLDWDWVTGDCARGRMCHYHCGWCKAHGQKLLHDNPHFGRGAMPKKTEERNAAGKRFSAFIEMLRRLQRFVPRRIGGPVYVADCHADIIEVLPINSLVWTIDAHHDNGDTPLHCGCWETVAAEMLCKVEHLGFYNEVVTWPKGSVGLSGVTEVTRHSPPERLNKFNRRIDITFICRSGPFTPRNYDHGFNMCLEVLNEGHVLTFMGHKATSLRRSYQAFLRRAR